MSSSSITGDGGSLSFSSGNNDKKAHSNGSSSTTHQPSKKRRNLPGNPDPSAEVISLSPTTLMARNRFVCEICNKGFQRDQNLQLHRRGHNLPWKLKQRSSTEMIRKRVYVCPEPSCVHHNPARALGDLTGVKKHFSRKHGDKKWKCDKCSKKYAVQSDWKAHIKTCGTKEYKCDCGTIFSRRDSFITHRAFCDALAEENNKAAAAAIGGGGVTNFGDQVANIMSSSSCSAIPTSLFSRNNNMNPNNIFGNLMPPAAASGPGLMSATALLQKAAQMGATSTTPPTTTASNNYNNATAPPSFDTTAMAPASFTNNSYDHQLQQAMGAMDGGYGMFSGLFGENNAILKQQAAGSDNKLMSRQEDMMTVDFLGIGGSSAGAVNLEGQQMGYGGGVMGEQQRMMQELTQFQHQQPQPMDKSLWEP